ncbi:trypsin-7-like [Chrysoperla carnea]|uniref:trypsin-7-like n=1 Tax=Chrysoperla carnea TaxID=189513 RepID=UPI001D081A85|nr:trypsin-7-like [Chrysoperla carnea]
MTSKISFILFSLAIVGIAKGVPAENEKKIAAPTFELIQPKDNKTIKIDDNKVPNGEEERILLGYPAPKDYFPFVVSLQIPLKNGGMHKFCGGSIINDRLILTAAHCFDPLPSTIVYVKAGSTNAFDPKGQTREVARIIKHPCYNQTNVYGIPALHDIAILVLSERLQISPSVQTISLATDLHDVEEHKRGDVLGWGATHSTDHTQSSKELLFMIINVISLEKCAQYFKVHSNVLCVSNGDNSDSGPCVGDSGGPFVQKVGGKHILAGLTSYGSKTCGKIPTVYTRVSKYLSFIRDVFTDNLIIPVCA